MAPPPRRPPLPLHRLREDPRRHRGGRHRASTFEPRAAGRRRQPRRQVRGRASWRSATAATSTTSACPGMLHAALHLTDHARADVVAHRHRGRARRARRRRRVHRRRHPGRAARRHHLQGLAGDDPRRRPHVVRRRRAGDRRGRDPRSRPAPRRALVEVDYDVLPPVTDPLAAVEPARRARRVGHRRQRAVASASTPAATSTPRSPPAPTSCTRCSRPSASSTPSSSPSRRSPCRRGDGDDRTLHVYSGGQGVWDDRNDIASRPRRRPTTQVTVELVSNGGAFGGKEDMSNQAQTALAAWLLERPVKCTLSREESLRMHAKRHPIRLEYWAGCDADGQLTALRVRARRRLRRRTPSVGHEGARAGRRPRQRAVPRAGDRRARRSPCAPTTRCAARSAGSAPTRRSSPWRACSTGWPTPVGISGWEIRKRNVIQPGRRVGPGPDHGRRLPRRRGAASTRSSPHYDAAVAAGKAVGLGLGLKNSRPRQRVPRGRPAPSCASAATTARVEVRHGWTEMGQGVHTVALQVAVEELGIDPDAHRRDRRHHPRARLRPDHRIARHADGGRRGAAGVRRRRSPTGARPSVDYDGEHVVDWTAEARRPGRPEPDDPLRVRLRRADGRDRPRRPARSSGSSPSTTSARRSTRCCARARSRAACTWASATR